MAILLPITIYVLHEMSQVSESENQLKALYEQQLKAFIFSVNLYSEDLMSSISFKLTTQPEDSTIQQQFYENPYILCVSFTPIDSVGNLLDSANLHFQYPDENRAEWQKSIRSELKNQTSVLKDLVKFEEKGFRKLQPLPDLEIGSEYFGQIGFVLNRNSEKQLCLLSFDTELFINQTLQPRVKFITKGETDILIRPKKTSKNTKGETVDFLVSQDMWLLPNYELGVVSAGATLYEVIYRRTQLSIFSLVLLLVFIVFGVIIMFRSLRREVDLAQQKSDFVSNVSHEIRTPLALISMFAETLSMQRVKSEERKQEYYEIILKETSRLTNLVNRILNFSQIEANKRQYQRRGVNLEQIVSEVMQTYSYHLERKGFEFQLETESSLPTIQADPEAVAEAVVNLLDNAMKYSLEEKTITVRVFKSNQSVCISVKDKGIGISKNKIPHIFDKFYRVAQSDRHDTKGSGLGLSILKHIMDAHNGEIRIDSEVGRGSVFTLEFPI